MADNGEVKTTHPHVEKSFQREEVRAVLVIGVIATLIALRNRLGASVPFLGIPLGPIVDLFLAYWGLYIFLMAIGVSDDIFPSRVSTFTRSFANFALFAGGIVGMLALLGFIALLRVSTWFVSSSPWERFGAFIILVTIVVLNGINVVIQYRRMLLRRRNKNALHSLSQER